MPPRPRLLSPWDLATAGGVLALALYYARVAPLLPERVATHFDALGHANGWTPKADLPWVLLGLTLLPWLVLLGVGAVLALVPAKLAGTQGQAIQPLRGLLGLGTAGLMGACLSIPLQGTRCLVCGLVFFGFCLAAGVALLVRASAQGLAAMPHGEHYRLGVFYVNPEDPRLWVAKRLGVGWTLNFAQPAAYWIMALLLLVPLLLLLLRPL